VKVSPLALATYEILAAKTPMSAYDLATQLGKEVTEGAVLRALTELWSQLRVLPVVQWDGAATVWELASARFTKQIKAGANAGQPSALSALITLYLGQAIAAEEAEIESFLSPLASRSRVRDVIHALLAGRQLETVVVKGKTLLHVSGDAPVFAAVEEAAPVVFAEGGSRISKFAGKPENKLGTGLRTKPKGGFAGKPAFGKKPFGAGSKSGPAFGAKPAFGDRERRPFKREEKPRFDKPRFDKPRFDKPRFDKPWEEKTPRADAPPTETPSKGIGIQGNAEAEVRAPRRDFAAREDSGGRRTFSKPGTFGRKREGFGGKPAFGSRPSFGDRPSFGSRPSFGDRSEGRPPRRDAGERGERPAGGGFKRPGSFTPRPSGDRGGFAGKPSFGPKRDFGGKPSFGAKPPFRGARPDAGEGGEAPRKVFRKFDAPRGDRPFAAKPFGAKPFGAKPFGGKPAGGKFGERPPRSFDGPRAGGDRPRPFGDRPRPFGDRPAGDRPRPSFGAKPGGFAGRSDGPRKPFGAKPFGERTFGDKKPGGFGPKKTFGKPGGFKKPGGPFAKFEDGKKPFRKPGPGKRTERPSGGDGGYRPTKRRRDEGGPA
jgi:hypothetical protein